MKELENNAYFWQKLDALFLSGDFKVLYKKGSEHPKIHGLVFPCDYGHIETLTGEGQTSLRVMKSANSNKVQAVVVCANLLDRNVNVVALVGLSEGEEEKALAFRDRFQRLSLKLVMDSAPFKNVFKFSWFLSLILCPC